MAFIEGGPRGSFEEADLTPDFIDCWHVVRGNVERITGDSHHGSYALRLAAGAVLSYAASDAAAIATCGSEALNGYLAVRRGTVAVNFAFRDKNGRDCGSKRLLFDGGNAWRGHEFRILPPKGAAAASFKIETEDGADIDSAYLGRASYEAAIKPAPAPIIADVSRVPLALPKSEVKPFQGVPTWFIDGQPVVNSLYTCRPRLKSNQKSLDYHREIIKKGNFPICVVGATMTCDDAAPPSFRGPHNPEEFFKVVDYQTLW